MEFPPICPGATPALQVGLKRPVALGLSRGDSDSYYDVIHHGWEIEANGGFFR